MGFPQKTKSMRFYHSFGVEYNHDGGICIISGSKYLIFCMQNANLPDCIQPININ